MERNLTDVLVIGSVYRFQFNEAIASDWLELVDIVDSNWVLAKDHQMPCADPELINLSLVIRILGRNFKKAVEKNET